MGERVRLVTVPGIECELSIGRCENQCCCILQIEMTPISGQVKPGVFAKDKIALMLAWGYLADVLKDQFGVDVIKSRQIDIVVQPPAEGPSSN